MALIKLPNSIAFPRLIISIESICEDEPGCPPANKPRPRLLSLYEFTVFHSSPVGTLSKDKSPSATIFLLIQTARVVPPLPYPPGNSTVSLVPFFGGLPQ